MTPGALNSVPGSGGESIKPLIECSRIFWLR
jgi:hypothetical protein